MSIQHEISEYIDNLPLKAVRCKGYRPDEVYEVICHLSTLYNQLLSQMCEENESLKKQLEDVEKMHMLSSDEIEEGIEETAEEEDKAAVFTSKEVQKLKRGELLSIMLEQSKENDSLKLQIEEKNSLINQYKRRLSARKIEIDKAGTIAEASFHLNGVFEAAEKASQQYLDNLQDLYDREHAICTTKEEEFQNKCAAIMQATLERCDFMKRDTEKQCEIMLHDVEQRCRERELVSEEKCAMLDRKAKENVDSRWNELSKRLEEFYASHEGLREMMANYGEKK